VKYQISNIKYQIRNTMSFIGNWKLEIRNSHARHKRGFTLIELLMTTVILLTFGGVIVTVFISLLRNTNRANSLAIIRQNGNFVINEMTRSIRYAQSLDNITSCNPSYTVLPPEIIVTSPEGQSTAFRCENSSIDKRTGSGSYASLLSSNVTYATCSISCQQTSTAPPTVMIQFTLVKDATSLTENRASIDFSTSVVLRNWGR